MDDASIFSLKTTGGDFKDFGGVVSTFYYDDFGFQDLGGDSSPDQKKQHIGHDLLGDGCIYYLFKFHPKIYGR